MITERNRRKKLEEKKCCLKKRKYEQLCEKMCVRMASGRKVSGHVLEERTSAVAATLSKLTSHSIETNVIQHPGLQGVKDGVC